MMDSERKRQATIHKVDKEEMSQRKDGKKSVNSFGGVDHKGFQAQIHFMEPEHDLDFPAARVMSKDF